MMKDGDTVSITWTYYNFTTRIYNASFTIYWECHSFISFSNFQPHPHLRAPLK